MIKIIKAEPVHAEQISAVYHRQYGNYYPHREFTVPELIRKQMNKPDLIWKLALDSEKVVGTMLGLLNPSNRTYEGGRVVIDHDQRGLGIATLLHEAIWEEAGSRDYELVYYTMREKVGISAAGEKLGLTLCGYLPGKHRLAGKRRENHPFFIKISQGFSKKRRAPDHNLYHQNSYLMDILDSLSLENRSYPYPSACMADCYTDRCCTLRSGIVHYSYSSDEESLSIGKIVSDNPLQLLIDLFNPDSQESIPEMADAKYIELDVLADKSDLIADLEKIGFRRFVFLPGWFLKDGLRFDCFRMVHNEAYSRDEAVAEIVSKVQKEFTHKGAAD
ncbi:MAG: GNAT family N-acetyltransferase [Candidatus Wallbacteria bacterium]|nr:GNAT family N-acetyltransferase [Candidatus Wallbacteria bacterium]